MPDLILPDSVVGVGSANANAQGSVASRLLSNGMNVSALRTNATLRYREWIEVDTAVITVAQKILVGVADLVSRGLTFSLPNALGHTRLEWERISDMDPAIITMSGISESENDRVNYDLQGMPIPIIHKDFNINIRALMASRNEGIPLDTTQAQLASTKVAQTIETMLFKGASVLGSNNPIYGYTTAPYRNTGSLTGDWMVADPADIVSDILAMIQAEFNDNFYGPFVLYVPTNVAVRFGEDYKQFGDKSIMQRILEIPQISDIKWTKDLNANEVVLVQMSREVVDLVDGMQPTTVEWESHGGMIVHFKVMAIMIPRIRNDQINQSGLAHYSS